MLLKLLYDFLSIKCTTAVNIVVGVRASVDNLEANGYVGGGRGALADDNRTLLAVERLPEACSAGGSGRRRGGRQCGWSLSCISGCTSVDTLQTNAGFLVVETMIGRSPLHDRFTSHINAPTPTTYVQTSGDVG